MMAEHPLPVLVVDQEDASRNRLAGLLRGEGFTPFLARTGEEAVEVVRNRVVAITILDVFLPDLSGIETFRMIASVQGGVQGVFLVRERTKDMLVRLLEAGAYTFLPKPPQSGVLIEAMRGLASRIRREARSF